MRKTVFFLVSVLFSSSFLANSYSAQVDYFLKLDGIDGESTILGESGWIQLYSVQYNESDLDFVSGSVRLESGEDNKLTIHKQIDKSSPVLFESSVSGKHIKTASLAVCQDGKCETKITFSDIFITNLSLNSENDPAVETIQMHVTSVGKEAATSIPDWIKDNAKWFAEGAIRESDFTNGIEYMIKEGIMRIPNLPPPASGVAETKVPDWVKNNAMWWSDGLITDDDFVKGIQYLVEKGIIRV
ncbi:MAG: type VI secretion system tube protein Hcp [Nitrosopumilaceae archaeon]